MNNTALILIDIQRDYFPNGALPLHNPEHAADNASQLLRYFRTNNNLIIHTYHASTDAKDSFMLPNSEGQKIHDKVRPNEGETCIKKHFPSAFWQTELEERLHRSDVQNVILAGMMSHMCVSATARASMERGFATTVVHDACATRSLQFKEEIIPAETVHKTALAELSLFAELVDTKSFINQN